MSCGLRSSHLAIYFLFAATEAGFLHPDGIFAVSQRMRDNIPQSIILGQYSNPSNSLAHYDGTGSEIVWQFDGDVDMVVAGAGTGGTVSGMGKKLKEQVPKCKIVSFDPLGSILARPESLNESDVTYFDVEVIIRAIEFPLIFV